MDQLRLYLESDLSQATKDCNECPTPDEQKDEAGYCFACPFREIDARLPPGLREWADNLIRLFHWSRAGYDLDRERLGWAEWQALAVIAQRERVKEIEAMQVRFASG